MPELDKCPKCGAEPTKHFSGCRGENGDWIPGYTMFACGETLFCDGTFTAGPHPICRLRNKLAASEAKVAELSRQKLRLRASLLYVLDHFENDTTGDDESVIAYMRTELDEIDGLPPAPKE